jgi:rubrerythrin
MTEKNLTTLIEMAIQREIEAYDFYMELIEKLSDATAKDTLLFIAAEEKKHRAFLESYREGRYDLNAFRMKEVTYYKIAEYEKEPDINPDMPKEHVFLLAAHRELRSHNFYKELAEAHPEGEAKEMLLKMANEELKHKEKMEYLYANTAFPQTSGG